MRARRILVIALTVAALAAAPAGAQQAQQPAGGRQGAAQDRVALERQVRARIHRMMRENLGLDEQQLARLDASLRTFEGRRMALLREERRARMALRGAMGGEIAGRGAASAGSAGATAAAPDDARIAAALDSLVAIQRRRIDLIEEEQRHLATFLTPLQRARYFALQENLRRLLEERSGGPGPGGRPGARRPDGKGGPPPE